MRITSNAMRVHQGVRKVVATGLVTALTVAPTVSALTVGASAVLTLLSPTAIQAQARPDAGTLELSVVDDRTGDPMPYAVVRIATLNVERFTDSRGRLILPNLALGSYDVSIRRLGFTPVLRQVTIGNAAPATVLVRLDRLPQQLRVLRVTPLTECATPGSPDPVREPEVSALVSLLRENADRYRVLVSQYPFLYTNVRALGDLRDSALFVESVDLQPIPSRTRVAYRPGRVVVRRENRYSMSLPTILDLADDGFASSHCFAYGGATTQSTVSGDETWFRLDVRAADNLNVPDVHGSFYLDSASAQLRKMDLELSRADKLPRQLSSIAAVHVSTGFVEIASGISVIRAVCAITRLSPDKKKSASRTPLQVPVELQQLVSYHFTSPPPDVPDKREFDSPIWEAQSYLPQSAIWCQE